MLEVKEEWHRRKTEFDQERHQKMQKVSNAESQLKKREENLENRMDLILKREKQIQDSEIALKNGQEEVVKKSAEVEKIRQQQFKNYKKFPVNSEKPKMYYISL